MRLSIATIAELGVMLPRIQRSLPKQSKPLHTIRSRSYATISSGKHFRNKGPPLSLEHFVQRQRALILWRDVVRAVNKIPASSTRDEMRKFARDEFERNKEVLDIGHIRYLISTGRTQFDGMKRYVFEQAM